jgi:tyrosine-protein phosphatase SIW14
MTRFLFCTAVTIFLMPPPQLAAQQVGANAVSGKKPPFAKKIQLNGVHNAGKISEYFYRGSQPNQNGMRSLQKLGVTTVIDLRGEDRNASDNEKKQAESLGMQFLLIPGDGWSNPSDAQIAEFFSAFAQRPQQLIFVHCWLGEDRTGVFVAAYRIAFEHWTPQQAVAEMHDFHFNTIWHPSMQDYIKHFPERLATSQKLAPYRSLPPPASSPSTAPH